MPDGGNGRSKSASIINDDARVSTMGRIAGISQLSGASTKNRKTKAGGPPSALNGNTMMRQRDSLA
ncbi:Uncharacterised protein [Mycobacteroides abscessus subsp. abscessus]|nr:Uncharacterised protein [Mycobacteroides abscessus subsp. abscessus]